MDAPRLLDGRLKLRHLALVDMLTRYGSVVGAAAALHITQPVATRTLRELEAILNVPLYERGSRGVTPTVFGETFTKHARCILDQLTQASRQVIELAGADRGTVTVGTDNAEPEVLLFQAIARLKNDRPQLTVVVREGAPEQLSVELEAGRLDMVVGRFSPSATVTEVRTPLYRSSLEIFTCARHPVARRRMATFADLEEYPWIVCGKGSVPRRDVEDFFVQRAMPFPERRTEVSSFLCVRELLLNTEFVGFLPSLLGRQDARLSALPLSSPPVGHIVGITTTAGRALGPGAAAFIQTLQKAAASHLTGAATGDFDDTADPPIASRYAS